MTKGSIEVEIKIPLTKQTYGRVRRYLQKHTHFIGKSRELDKYYTSPHKNFLATDPPVEYLRLRLKSGTGTITYKKVHLDATGRRTHSDEYESGVDRLDHLEKILSVLDFVTYLTLDKQRETFEFENKFEIALDFVKDLGYFIEIEALQSFGSKEKALSQVAAFAKSLGLNPAKVDRHGYVLGLMEKKGLVKKI